MLRRSEFRYAALAIAVALSAQAAAGAEDSLALVDFAEAGTAERCVPSSAQVTFELSREATAPGLLVRIAPGAADYPGLGLKPQGAAWDLSRFGHVEARLTNTCERALNVSLRVTTQVARDA